MSIFRTSREIAAPVRAVFEDHAFAENAREFLETANAQNLDRLTREVCPRT